MKLKLLDLFSGIGGFSLGLESTGFFETIAFVEKDKFCQKVLKKNFKNITIEGDIRNVKGSNYKADVITGGFPCQPFSVAGKRKGTDDDRYLWDETIRVVKECKPRWFIGENVEGIINIQDGMVLRQVQDDLETEGFKVQCLVIPASSIGAWHQRKRVWIIAHSNSNRDRNEITSSNGKEKKIQREHREKNSSSWKFIGTTTPGEQCQRTWWQIESGICGIPHGLSKTLDKSRANRIKSLGNSIVPQIARQLGLAIMKAELNETR
jgi:DNA (cytosine-5)-methyltransferase 1